MALDKKLMIPNIRNQYSGGVKVLKSNTTEGLLILIEGLQQEIFIKAIYFDSEKNEHVAWIFKSKK